MSNWFGEQMGMALLACLCAICATALCGCGGGGGGGDAPTSIQPDCLTLGFDLDFLPVTLAQLNTTYVSNELQTPKLCTTPQRIYLFGPGEYSLNGGPWSTETGTFNSQDRLRIRLTSAATFGTTVTSQVEIVTSTQALGTIFASRATFMVSTAPGRPEDAPLASITSPLDQSTVDARYLPVSGTASDPDGVHEVTVNGIPAVTNDGFTTWSAEIHLVTGSNTITIGTTDDLLNHDPQAAVAVVDNTSIVLQDPSAIAADHDNNRLLVVDAGWEALIAIDLATDEHLLISGSPQTLEFVEPTRLAISPARDRAWIADDGYEDLIAVDLTTGARSLLEGDGDPLQQIRDLAVDEVRGRILVLRSRLDSRDDDTQIYAMDMSTGDREVLSDNLIPNSDNPFHLASVIVFDTAGDRLVVLQPYDVGGYAVDPVTGSRMIFVDAPFGNVVSADIDPVLARIIAGEYRGAIHAVDLVSGIVQPLWTLPAEYALQQLALDTLNNRLLVQRRDAHNIGALDLDTGEFRPVY